MTGIRDTLYHLIWYGPLSVTLDATTWWSYQSGIFNDCPTEQLHYGYAVNLIGVQSDGVWIVRNSHGIGFGENGYIRLAAGNSCGITDYALLPLIA